MSTPATATTVVPELADAEALARLADWASLPKLGTSRMVRASSYQRPQRPDVAVLLMPGGNADNNNFVCASRDAVMAQPYLVPPWLEEGTCAEHYVHGFVAARFSGSGSLVRLWLTTLSLLTGRASDVRVRIYVDDEETPVVEAPLPSIAGGSVSPMFAPPFGAGERSLVAWYYPVVFAEKLIIAVDNLPSEDLVYYQADAALDNVATTRHRAAAVLPGRDAAAALLGTLGTDPLSGTSWVAEDLRIAPGSTVTPLKRDGPGTVTQIAITFDPGALEALADVDVNVAWDGTDEFTIGLIDLLAATGAAPIVSSVALGGSDSGSGRRVSIKLPMPFESSARWSLHNQGRRGVAVHFEAAGLDVAVADTHLNVTRSTYDGTGRGPFRVADLQGPVRLVGTCMALAGHSLAGEQLASGLNFLEGDETVTVDDGTLAGTGTEDYFDGAFYFQSGPYGRALTQAWDISSNDSIDPMTGSANGCRWHVLGGEIDAAQSLRFDLEVGPRGQPPLLDHGQATVFWYR